MRVFLTVSALATTSSDDVVTQREIILNWYNGEVESGDWVGLFDHDPVNNPVDPLKRVMAADYPSGSYTTSVMFPRPDLNNISMERQCLGFWIGYIRLGSTIASDCLKIQPNWMWEIQNEISPLRFRELMIPGAHDSGSYEYYVGKVTDNIVTRWATTQEDDFWEQLMYGIRHFDLRIAYYSETPEKFWLNHSFVKIRPLSIAIESFKKFLNATREVLLLDIHGFPVGFTNRVERHVELIEYLTQELGEYMLSPSVGYDVTMDAIWKSGKRVIVDYADSAGENSDLLWPAIPQVWANTMDINVLKDYLQQYMDKDQTQIWSAMAELTPTAMDVLFTNSSLRILAEEVNSNVTVWARDLWWQQANVIAVDFFMGTNIVDVSVESNLKRRICLDRYYRFVAQAVQQAQAKERLNNQSPPTYLGPRSSVL